VLNGIGGRTIAEAKERMSYREALEWGSYIRKHGSLNVCRRVEQSIALLAVAVIRSQGGKAELIDFMPHAERPEPEKADIGSVFSMLSALQKKS
jgi:hypothetical protein